jgi:hypothetical protein
MSMWLYQINQQVCGPSAFGPSCGKGRSGVGRSAASAPQNRPEAGDTVVFYCTKSKGSDPGFYGWAVVAEYYEPAGELYFMPTAPTNYLKMTPWCDEEAEALADRIRGKMKQATLFQINNDVRDDVRDGIRRWLRGATARR